MGFIDAHVHVWTDDIDHYPLGPGYTKEDMQPPRFTPEDLFKHTKPAGVDRINLIQNGRIALDERTADTSVADLTELVVEEYKRARIAAHEAVAVVG